jgi:hypothetical protein
MPTEKSLPCQKVGALLWYHALVCSREGRRADVLQNGALDLVRQVTRKGKIRYCRQCHCLKPDRSHHCSACGHCVLKMDHHWCGTVGSPMLCPLMGRCAQPVGQQLRVLVQLQVLLPVCGCAVRKSSPKRAASHAYPTGYATLYCIVEAAGAIPGIITFFSGNVSGRQAVMLFRFALTLLLP